MIRLSEGSDRLGERGDLQDVTGSLTYLDNCAVQND